MSALPTREPRRREVLRRVRRSPGGHVPGLRRRQPPANKFCHQCGTSLVTAPSPAPFISPESYTPHYLAEKILTSKSALEGERKQDAMATASRYAIPAAGAHGCGRHTASDLRRRLGLSRGEVRVERNMSKATHIRQGEIARGVRRRARERGT